MIGDSAVITVVSRGTENKMLRTCPLDDILAVQSKAKILQAMAREIKATLHIQNEFATTRLLSAHKAGASVCLLNRVIRRVWGREQGIF